MPTQGSSHNTGQDLPKSSQNFGANKSMNGTSVF